MSVNPALITGLIIVRTKDGLQWTDYAFDELKGAQKIAVIWEAM